MIQMQIIKYAIAATLALALVGGFYVFARHEGYRAASSHYEAILATERAASAEAAANEARRQTIANNAAKKREAEALAEIAQREQEITELRKKLADESKQDPDAGRVAIGAGSVRRIDQIR